MTDSFLDSLVSTPLEEKHAAEMEVKKSHNAQKSQNKVTVIPQEGTISSIKKDIEFKLEQESGRAVPTMVHLSQKSRKQLEALVINLQNKYQKKFTVSQIGALLIEKGLTD